ncbi:MAG: hypothetical protein HRK26_04655 [Rickettsiaceae bacterium H1]|nr:hypothetical protein [Rickettsiaceae bacterium H1]
MKVKNVFTIISLIFPVLVIILLNSGLGINLDGDTKTVAISFGLMSLLLSVYSLPHANISEIIGASLYFISTTLIILSNNFITMICAWELAALSAILLISCGCKTISPVLRYAGIHFVGGTLILAAIPYELMFTKTSLAIEMLNSTQLTLLAIGVLINCAAFPLSTWLTASYPVASPHGTAVLQLFVTKSALFTLFNLFYKYEILIPLGFITAIYASIYSFQENKLRKILAYNTIGQMGLLIASVGFGANITPYLISSVIYQTIMYLVASSIIYATEQENLQKLGGLFKQMPILGITSLIALSTMSSLPLTIGFNAKYIVTESIGSPLLLVLFLFINYGLITNCGMRLLYCTFFDRKKYSGSLLPMKLAPKIVLIILSILCFFPLVKVNSAYSHITILKQSFFFVITCVAFYSIRKSWYNVKYRPIKIEDIYRLTIMLVSRVVNSVNCHQNIIYKFIFRKVNNRIKNLEDLTFETVSQTILCAIVIIGILASLYV